MNQIDKSGIVGPVADVSSVPSKAPIQQTREGQSMALLMYSVRRNCVESGLCMRSGDEYPVDGGGQTAIYVASEKGRTAICSSTSLRWKGDLSEVRMFSWWQAKAMGEAGWTWDGGANSISG